MNWVLTGDEKYEKDSEAIGCEAMVRKKKEDAQLKKEGQARIKNRKGKGSNFFKRPDKTKTEKRRALSNTKSDTMIDLNHYPDEADDSDE